MQENLIVTSPSFKDQGNIPMKHTGFGEDLSPAFELRNLSDKTISIVILMDDLDIPFMKAYNHWVIWNIPKQERIPEGIPAGATVPSLAEAKQGIGYGHNQYRGPKQPFFIRAAHRYQFHFYTLDCFLVLGVEARKSDVVEAMEGHILQHGSIMGSYKR